MYYDRNLYFKQAYDNKNRWIFLAFPVANKSNNRKKKKCEDSTVNKMGSGTSNISSGILGLIKVWLMDGQDQPMIHETVGQKTNDGRGVVAVFVRALSKINRDTSFMIILNHDFRIKSIYIIF